MMKKIDEWIDGVSRFVGGVFSEPDGKPSFSRIAAAYVIWKIVDMADSGAAVSQEMMLVFWALMGTQTISKFRPGNKAEPVIPEGLTAVVTEATKTSSIVTSAPTT